jgi:salicylate hydroxylase
MSFRRWKDGEVIGYTKLVPEFRQNFNAPYYVIHRAHFHDALHKLAIKLGVNVRVASRAIEYNADAAAVKLSDGTWYEGDLIVAADGKHPFPQQESLPADGIERH